MIIVLCQESIFQLYHDKNKWHFDEMMMMMKMSALYKTNTLLDNYSASSLKQQSTGRYVTPLKHSSQILSHPVFAHTHQCCVLWGEGADTNFVIFGLIRPVLFPTHEDSMPTITPLMQSVFL